MTRTQARKEAQRIRDEQRRFAEAQRAAQVRNSVSVSDGTAFVYHPVKLVEECTIRQNTDKLGEIEIPAFRATFGRESHLFPDRRSASAWVETMQAAWDFDYPDGLKPKKLDLQILGATTRISSALKMARDMLSSDEVVEHLDKAIDHLILARQDLPD